MNSTESKILLYTARINWLRVLSGFILVPIGFNIVWISVLDNVPLFIGIFCVIFFGYLNVRNLLLDKLAIKYKQPENNFSLFHLVSFFSAIWAVSFLYTL